MSADWKPRRSRAAQRVFLARVFTVDDGHIVRHRVDEREAALDEFVVLAVVGVVFDRAKPMCVPYRRKPGRSQR
jgi:hypothetical protein